MQLLGITSLTPWLGMRLDHYICPLWCSLHCGITVYFKLFLFLLHPDTMASPTSPQGLLENLQQKITDDLECAICMNDCVNPKSLPCTHVYCLQCLEIVVTGVRRRDSSCDTIECPQCRKLARIPEGGAAGFPVGFLVNKMKEVRTVIQTVQQLPLGDQRNSQSSGREVARDGKGTVESNSDTCHQHPSQKLRYFCESCEVPLCASCRDSTAHKYHRCNNLATVVRQCKEVITSCLHPLKEHQSAIELAVLHVDAESGHITQQAEDVRSQIDADINNLQAVLEQRRAALKKEVGQIAEGKVQALSTQKKGLQEMQEQIQGCVSDLQYSLRSGGSRQVVAVGKAVHKRTGEILAKYHDRIRTTPIEKADLFYLHDDKLQQDAAAFGLVACSGICPSQCRASGDGLERTTLGETAFVTLTTFDQDGSPCQKGLQLISLELVSLVDGGTQVGKVKSEVGNQRVLTYHAVTKGEHQLRLKVNGQDIRGSPFMVMAYAAFRFYGTFVSAITGLNRPWGLSVSKSGKLVVIDNTGWQGVHVYSKDGTKALEGFADSVAWSLLTPFRGAGDGQCNEPRGVATDNDHNILVVDGKAHRIQLFRSNGSFVKSVGSWGSGDLQFNDPVGIAVNRKTREVYVCDRRNHRIQVLSADLSFLRHIDQLPVVSGPTNFHYPWDVDFDSHGNVYVADCGNYCIKVFTPEGRYIRSIGCEGTGNGEFKHISSICIDKDDFVYAADKEKHCVSVFHPQGEFVMQFGRSGSGKGELYIPLGVAVDKEGFVYVSDSYYRVQVFQ